MVLYIIERNHALNANLKKVSTYIKKNESNFSKSHSGDFVVIAENNDGMIGVDIEKNGYRSMATIHYYFEKFISFQIKHNVTRSQDNFYKIWTAMEAYFKFCRKGFYADKQFVMNLEEKKIETSSEVLFFDYVNFEGYTLCLCARSKEELQSVKIINMC